MEEAHYRVLLSACPPAIRITLPGAPLAQRSSLSQKKSPCCGRGWDSPWNLRREHGRVLSGAAAPACGD